MKTLLAFWNKYRLEVIFFSIIVFVYLFNIWSIPIIDGDTFFYIAKAKRILISGHWFVFENLSAKPPLIIWISALFYKLFGANLIAVNLWHSLFSLATIVLVYIMGRRFFYRKVALYSAMIMASTLLFFYQDRTPMLDTPLTFFVTLSLFFIMLFEDQQKYRDIILAFFFAGLGFLTKGLLGLAIPFGAYFFYLIFIRELWSRAITHLPKFIAGLAVFLLVISVWIAPQMIHHGQDFTNGLYRENVERFFHTIDASGTGMVHKEGEVQKDYYAYIIYLALFFLPWTPFIIPALKKSGSMTGLLRSSFWFVFIVFSVSGHYKNPRYILPLFPALSLMIGCYLTDIPKIGKISKISYFIFGLLFALISAFLLSAKLPIDTAPYLPIVLTLSLGLALVLFLAGFISKEKPDIFFKTVFIAMMATLFAFIVSTAMYLPSIDNATVLSKEIQSIKTNEQIVAIDRKLYDLQFYLEAPVLTIGKDELSKLKNLPKGTYLIVSRKKIYLKNLSLVKEVATHGYLYRLKNN